MISAKVFCDWNAVEVLADLTVMDGSDVEEEEEADEEKDDARQTNDNLEGSMFNKYTFKNVES